MSLTLHGVPVYVSGVAGHFVNAEACRLVMHWRIGDLRVSTVGGYCPDGYDRAIPLGSGRHAETLVFRVTDCEHPEGAVSNWSEIAGAGLVSDDTRLAEAQHHAIAGALARLVSNEPNPTDEQVAAAVDEVTS